MDLSNEFILRNSGSFGSGRHLRQKKITRCVEIILVDFDLIPVLYLQEIIFPCEHPCYEEDVVLGCDFPPDKRSATAISVTSKIRQRVKREQGHPLIVLLHEHVCYVMGSRTLAPPPMARDRHEFKMAAPINVLAFSRRDIAAGKQILASKLYRTAYIACPSLQ